MRKGFLYLSALAAISLAPSTAWAGKYDIDLTSLGTVQNNALVQDNQAFRSLASEVGVLTAPKPVDAADSLGLDGFAVTADFSINTISSDQDFWTQTTDGPSNVVPTMQIMGRKGLWPGLEIGAGATKVFDSKMWALDGYLKVAVHENTHHLFPSIALRAMLSQLLGSKDLRSRTFSADFSISHTFGVGQTFNISPYLGYQALMIFAKSAVIDATPGIDEYIDGAIAGDNTEFVFQKQDLILRHRPFLGARMIFSVMRLGFEAMFVPGGSSGGGADSEDAAGVEAVDQSGLQQQYTFSVGLDF